PSGSSGESDRPFGSSSITSSTERHRGAQTRAWARGGLPERRKSSTPIGYLRAVRRSVVKPDEAVVAELGAGSGPFDSAKRDVAGVPRPSCGAHFTIMSGSDERDSENPATTTSAPTDAVASDTPPDQPPAPRTSGEVEARLLHNGLGSGLLAQQRSE